MEILNIDCMGYMRKFDDDFFDLAIVDPPYGLGEKLYKGAGYNRNRFSRKEMELGSEQQQALAETIGQQWSHAGIDTEITLADNIA